MSTRGDRGFTLIELLIALTIAAILLVLALPNYREWLSDAQIRNAASSLADGLRYAQGEAVKRNQNVEFVLNPGAGWTARLLDGTVLRSNNFREGSQYTVFTTTPATSTTVTFNALGLVEANNAAAPLLPFTRVNLTGPGGTRPLRVMVGGLAGGSPSQRIKICDTKYVWPDPKGCPP